MTPSPPDIYFLHIPKTAGSSLAAMIRDAYPVQERLHVHQWNHIVRMDRDRIQQYRCYTGHFGTSFYSLLDRNIATITLLRDPCERSISHLLHAERDWERKLRGVWWIAPRWMRRKFRDGWTKPHTTSVMGNFQTRSLGVDVDLNPFLGKPSEKDYGFLLRDAQKGQTMEEILERAKRRLDTMAVVGTVERFSESLDLICDFLNIPAPETPPVENVAPGRSIQNRYRASGEFPPEYIAAIDAANEYDRQLYEYANQLMDRQWEKRRVSSKASV
ncbi:hypothetical protein CCAX7_31980 [Capsulimonas corticalis]|uniref:Uncharacterized protein n=1 Tax=Capsulimonas corticalis TaxID=2219043 RepID=A0A402D450_9BACT|nr:sulfotransferase family 2 domain-containing protein [Capsulimonas corticalis]BDI31147.1 hypothetical protein CCAX7_31980 [Capsulimonas corticalis]